MSDSWHPATYELFQEERALPFHELLGLAEPGTFRRAVDLGCGTGELTALARLKLGIAELVGIDTSPAMLADARLRAAPGLSFVEGDLASWTSNGDHDLVLSNAALHWAADHRAVLGRWRAALAPGGQLLVQMPANSDHPSHRIAVEVARSEPFRTAFDGEPPVDPVDAHVLSPREYAVYLHELGFAQQHVRLQVFGHALPSTGSVVDWLRGTTLNRFKQRLSSELFDLFLSRYRERLMAVLGDRSPYFYPFQRLLFWARLPR